MDLKSIIVEIYLGPGHIEREHYEKDEKLDDPLNNVNYLNYDYKNKRITLYYGPANTKQVDRKAIIYLPPNSRVKLLHS